ncbi:MAG: SAM-dependent methyltransferase [Oscillospiraceae bacterium]
MNEFKLFSIGKILKTEEETAIVLHPEYAAALKGLGDFGYVEILWWMDGCDNKKDRASLAEQKPYVKGPDELGVFATRSPSRPNPIGLSCASITYIDEHQGIIGLSYLDANDESPVLDIKPYTPSLDRVERPAVPCWCAHWPGSVEESGNFDWESEFNF